MDRPQRPHARPPANKAARPGPRAARGWMALGMLSLLTAAVGLGALGQLAWQRYGNDVEEVRAALEHPELPDLGSSLAKAIERGPSKIIYLNREGAQLTGGDDDASNNRSSIVDSAGLVSTHVPAFAGTAKRWEQIVACVRSKFEPFDVQVVDERPVEGSYIMAMFGGRPTLLGDHLPVATQRVTGLAPFNGEPIPDAVVLIFTREMKESLRTVCETAGMEIAHAFGLDHARSCKDLMTYMPPCGPKHFVDADVPCGEDKPRACKGGATTQNSYARLLAVLGPRPPLQPEHETATAGKPKYKNGVSAAPLHVSEDGHFHEH